MNNIATQFSIKDLENLSNIKAHTIRIWEKRYNILEPERTDTNIRLYNLQNLQKLLNVTLLYNSGVKISKIAKLSDAELKEMVREVSSKTSEANKYVSSLQLAMLNFDQSLFESTYNRMIADASFRSVFLEVFVPLLHSIGLDWQSESITPAHEHFISNLIHQKLHINIERVQQIPPTNKDRLYVLYLPENEIHELGLLYIHYELMLKGHHSIYLGQSVPRSNLFNLLNLKDRITFISYFTVAPEVEMVPEYLSAFTSEMLANQENKLWLLGRNTAHLKSSDVNSQIELFNDLFQLINKI